MEVKDLTAQKKCPEKKQQTETNNGITCDLICTTDKITPKWIMVLKSFTRVFITYTWHPFVIIITFMYLIGKLHTMDQEVIMKILTIETVLILFWFGERLIRNTGITDMLTKFSKKENTNK